MGAVHRRRQEFDEPVAVNLFFQHRPMREYQLGRAVIERVDLEECRRLEKLGSRGTRARLFVGRDQKIAEIEGVAVHDLSLLGVGEKPLPLFRPVVRQARVGQDVPALMVELQVVESQAVWMEELVERGKGRRSVNLLLKTNLREQADKVAALQIDVSSREDV